MRLDTPPSSVHGDDEGMDEIYEEEDLEYVGELDDVLENIDGERDVDSDESEDVPIHDDAIHSFNRHTGSVFCGSIHPNGKIVVTGGEDDAAYVWDLATQEVVYECKDHEDSVIFASFSHDGVFLATGDMGGYVRTYKCPSNNDETEGEWKLVWEYQAGDICWGSWHSNARVLFAGACAGEVYMWKIPSGDTKVLQGHGSKSECGKLLTDGRRLAVGYEDGSIKIWDLKTATVIHSVLPEQAHTSSITTVDTFHDNNIVATGGLDGKVVLTKSSTGKTVGILDVGSEVEAIAFNGDVTSGLIAIGTLNGCLSVWDVGRQSIRHKLADKTDDNASGIVTVRWIDHYLAAACLDGSLRVYDTKTGSLCKTYTGHKKEILDMFYSPVAKMFLTTSDDSSARIFKFHIEVS